MYRGADKSLVRRWKETSYSDQTYNNLPTLMAYKHHKFCKFGRRSLFPSRVGLMIYQHPCTDD